MKDDKVIPSATIFDELSKTAQLYYNNKFPVLWAGGSYRAEGEGRLE